MHEQEYSWRCSPLRASDGLVFWIVFLWVHTPGACNAGPARTFGGSPKQSSREPTAQGRPQEPVSFSAAGFPLQLTTTIDQAISGQTAAALEGANSSPRPAPDDAVDETPGISAAREPALDLHHGW